MNTPEDRMREHGSPIDSDGTASEYDDDTPSKPKLVDILMFLAGGIGFAICVFFLERA